MSDYQTYRGKLVLASLKGESIEETRVRIMYEKGSIFDNSSLDDFDDTFYGEYITVEDNIYKIVESKNLKYEDSFCELSFNTDGTIDFYTTFYNGGTCVEEMVSEELKKQLNK